MGGKTLDNVLDSVCIMNDAKLQVSPADFEDPSAGWRVRLLGKPSLFCDGEPRDLPGEPRELALLAYLVSWRGLEDSATGPYEGLARRLGFDPEREAARLGLPSPRGSGPPSFWLDSRVFEALGRRGLAGERGDPRDLAEAARLYRADLLEGIVVESPEPLADWLVTERKRLRALAGEVLRALVDTYLARGERRLGTRWARRLVTLDPLGEEGHRYLIRCYGETGRKRQAQEQFEELRRLLAERLGCAPGKETRRALAQALEPREPSDTFAGEPVGPLLPLVGRDDAYLRLEDAWRRAATGCRMSLLSGEPGVGKTRLVRTLLDSLSSRGSHRILVARCDGLVRRPYGILAELLTHGREEHREEHRDDPKRLGRALGDEARRQTGRLLPELLARDEAPEPIRDPAERRAFFDGLVEALATRARLVDEEPGEIPGLDGGLPTLVIFIDDLHLADADTWDFLGHLLGRHDLTWWIVATCQPIAAEGMMHHLGAEAGERISQLDLERIPDSAIEEIAAALVEGEEVPILGEFLSRRGLGLPVAMAEWVNYLWDDRALLREEDHWRLDRSLDELELAGEEPIEQLTARRIQRLPNSARRLVALAAVIGQRVDRNLLEGIEEEHRTVVELGLQCLVERWILKPHKVQWSSAEPPGLSAGALGGLGTEDEDGVSPVYEFAHRRIRQAVYHSLTPSRRRILHAIVARHLVHSRTEGDDRSCEDLAHHFRAAGAWDEAYPYLRRAARKAVALLAPDTARHYFERAIEAIDRCIESARSEGETEAAERWDLRRRRVLEERAGFERWVSRAGLGS